MIVSYLIIILCSMSSMIDDN